MAHPQKLTPLGASSGAAGIKRKKEEKSGAPRARPLCAAAPTDRRVPGALTFVGLHAHARRALGFGASMSLFTTHGACWPVRGDQGGGFRLMRWEMRNWSIANVR
jgi:hypothetical protein